MSDSTVDRVRVLIVEDEALVADDLRSRLQRMGYEPVGIVDRAEHVLAAATELRPELALLDIKLKGSGDGVDAAQQLRARSLPFVFVTSHADKATLERACRTEPFGYLVKPFEDREVDAAVRMAMSRHRAETQLRSMGNWLSTVLRSIGDAVVVTDDQQRVTFLNEAGEQLTRWPR
jgi:DNA-binding NarL/FixJ family response regulator